MIAPVLALLLSASASQATAANAARDAYLDCLRNFMRASLRQRMEPDAFATAVAGQCTDRATAYRAALVQHDQRHGGGRAQAEADAQQTIDEGRENVIEYYRYYHESGAVPD